MRQENHVRHVLAHLPWYSLMIRNVSWYVTVQSVIEPLFGRPVLEVLRWNTSDILAAAADRYKGLLDLSHFCTDSDVGRIARVYEGFYHSDRGADEDESGEEQLLDLGEDKDGDWEEALRKALDKCFKKWNFR